MNRTKEEQVNFAFDIVSHLDTFPMNTNTLSKKTNKSYSELSGTLDKLKRALLIQKKKIKGRMYWYLLKKGRPTKMEIDTGFTQLNKKARARIKSKIGPEIDVNPLTKRKCRKCGQLLRASRYFDCEECVVELSTIEDDFIYADQWRSSDDEIFIGYDLDEERFSSGNGNAFTHKEETEDE